MRWQDLLAKLTGKPVPPPPPPPPPPEDAAPAGAGGLEEMPPAEPPASDPPPVPEDSTPPTPTAAEPENVEPMQSTQPANPEATPGARQPRAVKTDAVSRVYAQALLEMAEKNGELDTIADEVDQLDELLREQPALRQMLETPAIGKDQRRDLIDRVFKGRVSDTTWRFLQVVNGKHRAGAVPGILASFQQQLAEKRGIVEVNVTVAQKLEPADAEQVAQRIGRAIGKRVVLHQYVDASLIGGMVIRIGDQVIDGSVAAQLRNMKKQLIERGRDRARETT